MKIYPFYLYLFIYFFFFLSTPVFSNGIITTGDEREYDKTREKTDLIKYALNKHDLSSRT